MRILISLLSLLSAMGIMAQQYRTLGDFTSDTDGKSIHNAWLDLSLTKDNEEYTILSLKILPERDATYAVVDTLWRPGSAYRTDSPVTTDIYEERDIVFLYTFNTSDRLDTYYVFSRFVDTVHDNLTQVVVRKFAADGKRLWCFTADATDARAKEFSKVLTEARKKLRFKKTTQAKGEGRDKPRFQQPQERILPSSIGQGSPYGSGW